MKVEKKSKRQLRREQMQRKQARGRLTTIGIITVVAAFLVFAIVWPQLRPIAEVVSVESEPRFMADENRMGDPEAPIQITEYADFQCPFCDRFHTDTLPLLEQYYIDTGKVLFTYRSAGNFISDKSQVPNTESRDSAAAAYCAIDQGKFWDMHDAIYANNQDVENQGALSSRRLSAIAEVAGLDVAQYDECFNSGKYEDRVAEDFDDWTTAVAQGGTPFFLITYTVNGETKTTSVDGAQPFSEFQVTLEGILTEIGTQ